MNQQETMTVVAKRPQTRKEKFLTILTLTCALGLLLLDTSILPVALPTIRADIHLSRVMSQWIVNTFLLVNATFVFAGGRVSDIFGHRRIFCLGLFIYGFGSMMAAVSPNGEMLLIARVVQGLGGALMGPSAYALLYDLFPIGERGRAVGTIVGISSIVVSLGPFLGGFLAEYLSWRWIFWFHIPIVISGLTLSMKILPRSERKRDSFDFPGFLALSAALGSLTLAIMQGRDWGWTSPLVTLLLILCPLFFFLLIVSNRYAKHPFFNIELLQNRLFIRGICLLFGIQFVMMMSAILPLYFQTSFGFTPVEAGLHMLIASVPVIFCGPLSGYVSDHFSPKYPALTGFFCLICALSAFIYLSGHYAISGVWIALLLYGCGVSLVMTPTGTTTLSCVSHKHNGEATGIYNTARYSGSTLGMTLMCSLSNNISFILFEKSLRNDPSYKGMSVKAIWEVLVDRLHSPWLLDSNVRQAFIQSTNTAFAITCCVAASVALLCLSLSIRFFCDFERLGFFGKAKEKLAEYEVSTKS